MAEFEFLAAYGGGRDVFRGGIAKCMIAVAASERKRCSYLGIVSISTWLK